MGLLRSLFTGAWMFATSGVAAADDRLLVFAAASLTDVLTEVSAVYGDETGVSVTFAFAGSGTLARQIEAGAPADVYVSADKLWMDWVVGKGRVAGDSPVAFASNRLVIAVRNETENWVYPEGLITTSRFAMGEPESVPAGRYARQALKENGLWDQAREQAVFGENVRVTLRRLTLGEVGAAIVYRTDVLADPAVRSIYAFAEESHEPIAYLAAPVKGGSNSAARFVQWLSSAEAKTVLEKHGFGKPDSTD